MKSNVTLSLFKNVIAASALIIGSISFAAPKGEGIQEFKIVSANYAKEHVKNAKGGSLTANYENRTLKLRVESAPACPVGMMCPQVLKIMNVELPIVSEKTDSCGFHKVVARIDQRPVDGALQEIVLHDVINQSCPTIVQVIPKATFTTSSTNMLTGKTVTAVSELTLQAVDENPEFSQNVLVKWQMNIGFSPNPSVRTVTIDTAGNVRSQEEFFKDHKIVKGNIAKLSAESLTSLKAKVATIPEGATLVDENPGGGICMDAPTSYVAVYVGDIEVRISLREGCHDSQSYDGEATSVVSAMMGFVALAR